MAIWVSVNHRDNSNPIRNAYFSASYSNPNNDGNYFVQVNDGDRFWCDAEGFRVQYQDAAGASMGITLAPVAWPET